MAVVTRQVFRRGIELVRQGDGWKLSSGEHVFEAAGLARLCGATPMLIEQDYGDREQQRTFLMLPWMRYFDIETTWLMQRFLQPGTSAQFLEWNEVVYLLGAVGYHCSNLAEAYARIRKTVRAYHSHSQAW